MRHLSAIGVLGALLCIRMAAQQPISDELRHILDTTRETALGYNDALPDFICTEKVQRSQRIATFTTTDELSIQVTYFGHRENYRLIAINGTRSEQAIESLEGPISGGEFGTLLRRVFEPSSAADFEWKGWSNIRKQRVAVFSYRVAHARSHYVLGYRTNTGGVVTATAGHHGEVAIHSDTRNVLRLTAIADDTPKDSEIAQSSVEVDYDFKDIAGRNYWLPLRAVARMRRGYRQFTNTVEFVGYRKFDTDSKIDFRGPSR
jgi:hypothetical protein